MLPGAAPAQVVAVYGAPNEASWNTDIQSKIQATGVLTSVDAFLISTNTPTLTELNNYDAVLVYSDASFADAAAMGDVLADYLDAGGGVVLCTFAFISPGGLGIDGRIVTAGYLPYTQDSQSQNTQMQLVVDDPGHPLLAGVASFDGGSSSYHNATIALANGATQVAHWSGGQPLVAHLTPTAGTIVGLNFYPPSSDARKDFWLSSTDGGRLMANALAFAAGAAPADADSDGYTVAQGDCDDNDPGVNPGAAEVCDGVDQDCDGTVDEGTSCYDDDGDGYTEDQGDCDDLSSAIHPGAPELCNALDDNCNGLVDEDVDGDGYAACVDCAEGDPAISPGVQEDCGDGIDNDCDGMIDKADPECVVGDDDVGDDDVADDDTGDDDTGDDDTGDDDVGDDDVGDDDVGDDDVADDDTGDDDAGDDDAGDDDTADDDDATPPSFGAGCQCRVVPTAPSVAVIGLGLLGLLAFARRR